MLKTDRTQILTSTPDRRIDQDTSVGAPAATARKNNHQVRRRLQQNQSADDVVTDYTILSFNTKELMMGTWWTIPLA